MNASIHAAVAFTVLERDPTFHRKLHQDAGMRISNCHDSTMKLHLHFPSLATAAPLQHMIAGPIRFAEWAPLTSSSAL